MIDDEEPEPRLVELLADLNPLPAAPECRRRNERRSDRRRTAGPAEEAWEPVLFGGLIPILGLGASATCIIRAVRDNDEEDE